MDLPSGPVPVCGQVFISPACLTRAGRLPLSPGSTPSKFEGGTLSLSPSHRRDRTTGGGGATFSTVPPRILAIRPANIAIQPKVLSRQLPRMLPYLMFAARRSASSLRSVALSTSRLIPNHHSETSSSVGLTADPYSLIPFFSTACAHFTQMGPPKLPSSPFVS